MSVIRVEKTSNYRTFDIELRMQEEQYAYCPGLYNSVD